MRPHALTRALLLAAGLAAAPIAAVPAAAAPHPASAPAGPVLADPRCAAEIEYAAAANREAIALVAENDPYTAARANEKTIHVIEGALRVCPGRVHSGLSSALELARRAHYANSRGGAQGVQEAQYRIEDFLRLALDRLHQ